LLVHLDDKKSAAAAVPVLAACRAAFLYAAGSDQHSKFALELARTLLRSHLKRLTLMLSPTNTAAQAKAVLQCWSAAAACHPLVAAEILANVDLSHHNFEALARRRSKKSEEDAGQHDVRTCYVHFLLSFLAANSGSVVKQFLEKKSNFHQIFPGLLLDSRETVTLVLATLKSSLLDANHVGKTSKMRLLSAASLAEVAKLMSKWRGPAATIEEADEDDKAVVASAAKEFLSAALTSTKRGLVFFDPFVGHSGVNSNHLLLNTLKAITRESQHGAADLLASSLAACPDQLRPYLQTMEKDWSPPRDTAEWFRLADLIVFILARQDLPATVAKISEPALATNVTANLGFPERLLVEVISPSLAHESVNVRVRGLKLLEMLLEDFETTLKTLNCDQREAVLRKCQDRLPSGPRLAKLWTLTLADAEGRRILTQVADIFSFLLTTFPGRYATQVDAAAMLEETDDKDVKMRLVQCLPVDALKSAHLKMLLTSCRNGEQRGRETLLKILRGKRLLPDDQHGEQEFNVFMESLPKEEQTLDDMAEAIILADGKYEDSEVSGLTLILVRTSLKDQQFDSAWLPSLLALQERPEPLCRLVATTKVKVKVVSKVLKGQAPFEEKDLVADPLVSTMQLLCNYKVTNQGLDAVLDKLATMEDGNDVCCRTIASSRWLRSNFRPFQEEGQELVPLALLVFKEHVDEDARARYVRDLVVAAKDQHEIFDEKLFNCMKIEDAELEEVLIQALENQNKNLRLFCCVINRMLKQGTLIVDGVDAVLAHLPNFIGMALDEEAENVLTSLNTFLKRHQEYIQLDCEEEVIKKLVEKCGDFSACVRLLKIFVGQRASAATTVLCALPKASAALTLTLTPVIAAALTAKHEVNSRTVKGAVVSLKDVIASMMEGKGESNEDVIAIMEAAEAAGVLAKSKLKTDAFAIPLDALRARAWLALAGKDFTKVANMVLEPCVDMISQAWKNFDEKSDQYVHLQDLYALLDATRMKCDEDDLGEYLRGGKTWARLVKTTLKNCLKVSVAVKRPMLASTGLGTLAKFCKIAIFEDNAEEAGQILAMLCGHSGFLPILLNRSQPHSAAKAALAALLADLCALHPSSCSSSRLPALLGAYNGTLSLADRALLRALATHERAAVALFKPTLWGQAAMTRYAASNDSQADGNAIWKTPKVSEVLANLDADKMYRSAAKFPLTLTMEPAEDQMDAVDDAQNIYDPRFFLPLAAQLCAPGSFVDRHLRLIESGLLPLALAATSSRDVMMRKTAYLIMSRMHHALEGARLAGEKRIWLHLLEAVRNGIVAANKGDAVFGRIPPLIACSFLPKACQALREPSAGPVQRAITNYLLAKPALDVGQLPDFLRLFHGSDPATSAECRLWAVRLLRDGIRDGVDAGLAISRGPAVKTLLAFAASDALGDAATRLPALEALESAAGVPGAAKSLWHTQGLSAWLISQARRAADASTASMLAAITLTSWETFLREEDMPHWALDEVMLVVIALKANARCWLAKSTLERLLQVEADIGRRRKNVAVM